MSNTFAELKKTRTEQTKKLQEKIEQENRGYQDKDERFWKVTRAKDGTGYAVIRFLPSPKGEESAWVRIWNKGFKGPTGLWYVENCLTTLGRDDPVAEYASQLWAAGNEDEGRKYSRRLSYISNILVVKDPENPENEGKVFLFRYGKKIWGKINSKMNPDPKTGDPQINPFDLWEGCNFRLKMHMVDKFPNYDDSEWELQSAVAKDEKRLQEIWEQEYSLIAFLDEKNFKGYDELKARFNKVMGWSGAPQTNGHAEPEKQTKTESPFVVDEEDDPEVSEFAELLRR